MEEHQQQREPMMVDADLPTMEDVLSNRNRKRTTTIVVLMIFASYVPICVFLDIFGTNVWVQLLPYLFLLCFVSPMAAYCTRLNHGVVRWICGLSLIGSLAAYKSAVILQAFKANDEGYYLKSIIACVYAITALWECSNGLLVFGGERLQKRYGLVDRTSNARLHRYFVYAWAPSQVKFVGRSRLQNVQQQKEHLFSYESRTCRRTIHSVLAFILGILLLTTLRGNIGKIVSSHIVLEIESLTWLSTFVTIGLLNWPTHFWHIFFDLFCRTGFNRITGYELLDDDESTTVEVTAVLPYGCFYLSSSTREFWSRWSRPATSVIRHLFYHPLGGAKRWYLSIPIMFMLNASAHEDLSASVNYDKDRCEKWWNIVFFTLALSAMAEVGGGKLMQRCYPRAIGSMADIEQPNADYHPTDDVLLADEGDAAATSSRQDYPYPLWYRTLRGVLAHVSLRIALYVMVHYCFKTSLGEILGIED